MITDSGFNTFVIATIVTGFWIKPFKLYYTFSRSCLCQEIKKSFNVLSIEILQRRRICVYILNVCGYLRPNQMKSLGNLTHLITNVIFLFSFIHSEVNIRWPFPRKSHFDAFQCNDVTYVFSENWTVVRKCPPDPMEYYRDVLQWRHNESDGVSKLRVTGLDWLIEQFYYVTFWHSKVKHW